MISDHLNTSTARLDNPMGAFQAWRLETGASYDLRMIAHQCRQDLQKQRPVSAQAEMSASEASVYTSAPTSLSASAKAELIFGSEDTPENTITYGMTTEEAIEMAMLLVWPQLQLTTAPQLQFTSAAMPAPPAPTVAPPPSVRHPLWHHHPYPSPSQRHANYSAPPKRPRLLPCPQKPSHPAAPALLRPPRHHARSRAPELLTAAAALRSFVDEMVGLGGAQAA